MYPLAFGLHIPFAYRNCPVHWFEIAFGVPVSYTNHPEKGHNAPMPISQSGLGTRQPRVRQNFGDRDPFIHISIQHLADQIDATFRKREERYS